MITKIDLQMLKDKMAKLDEVKDSKKKLKDAYDLEKAPLDTAEEKINEEIADLKLCISEAALADFKISRNKSQLGGVKVQEGTNTSIEYSEKVALKFAKEKDMFLVLDKKAFEKAAPSLNLDFVAVKTIPVRKVTFPKVIKLED